MSVWRPIETAPKDGTAIWLLCEGAVFIGYCEIGGSTPWQTEDKWFLKAGVRRRVDPVRTDEVFGCYAHDAKPTRWMPLPDPP